MLRQSALSSQPFLQSPSLRSETTEHPLARRANLLHTLGEEHAKLRMLTTLRDNKNGSKPPNLTGVFPEYEDFGLPGYIKGDPVQVKSTTLTLLTVLKNNTKVTEFTLNLKALELLLSSDDANDDGINCLIHFLSHNPSLSTLHIRIPPGSKPTHFFRGLFDCCCQNLKVVTLWVPRQTTNYLGLMRMLSKGRQSVKQKNGSMPTAQSPSLSAMNNGSIQDVTSRIDPSHPIYSRIALEKADSYYSPQHRPEDKASTTGKHGGVVASETHFADDDYYAMNGIAPFLAAQPRLMHLRIQSSSLLNSQWAELMYGLAKRQGQAGTGALQHLELRRVEFEQHDKGDVQAQNIRRLRRRDDRSGEFRHYDLDENQDPSQYLTMLAPQLRRLDLHGTALDTSPLLIAKASDPSIPSLRVLSLSSSRLVCFDTLMHVLSSPKAPVQGLELSHLNLSGDKCRMLAAMMKQNKSIRFMDVSSAQLDCVDGVHLAMALKDNSTLLTLIAKENHMWHHNPNAQNQRLASVGGRTIDLLRTAEKDAVGSFGRLLEANTSLQALDLSDNGPGKLDGKPQFAPLLKGLGFDTPLKSLIIANRENASFNLRAFRSINQNRCNDPADPAVADIDRATAQALATVLRNDFLHELIFDYNIIGDSNISKLIAPALRNNQNLRVLGLKGTGIGNDSMIELAKSLVRHPSLEILDVSYNPEVTEEGYESLSKTVETLPKLHTLWFHSMARNYDENLKAQYNNTQIIGRALKVNHSLKLLSHFDWLKEEDRFYLLLNQCGRQQLNDHDIPIALLPQIFAGMPLPVISFYVRRSVTLLSSVNLARVTAKRRSKGLVEEHQPIAKRATLG